MTKCCVTKALHEFFFMNIYCCISEPKKNKIKYLWGIFGSLIKRTTFASEFEKRFDTKIENLDIYFCECKMLYILIAKIKEGTEMLIIWCLFNGSNPLFSTVQLKEKDCKVKIIFHFRLSSFP